MAALPYIQLYVADYLADTAHLKAVEHGAYLLLIMNYWQTGKPLNNANDRLTNVARMSKEEWNASKETLQEFFKVDGDTWTHLRIEADLFEVNSKATKASDAGKKSAEARRLAKLNERATDVKQTFNHTDTDTDTDTDKDTDKSKPKTTAQKLLATLEISKSVAEDFISLRNRLKAPITQTSLNGIQREAVKAGLTLEAALQICCERSWRGFKAEWVQNRNTGGVQEAQLDVARQIWGNQNGNDRSFIDIDASGSIESYGADIPKAIACVWEPTSCEVEGD